MEFVALRQARFVTPEEHIHLKTLPHPPEIMLVMAIIDQAIGEARKEYPLDQNHAAKVFLQSDYCYILAEWVFGTEYAGLLRNWALDDCPPPEQAWENRGEYW